MTDRTHRYELALEIGEEAVRQKHWQQAMTCFQTALIGLPREARIYNGLGDTHLALGDHDRALSCYKEAARLAGGDPVYTGKVAALQDSLGQHSDAVPTYLHTGDRLWQQGDHDRAQQCWERAGQLEPDLPAVHERLAMSQRLRGDTTSAARHYMAQAEGLRREGRCLVALHIAYTALSLAPDDAGIWRVTDDAWRCVAIRERGGAHDRQSPPGATRVQPGDLVSAATEFAQWQLSARLRQHIIQKTPSHESDLHLRQAMVQEGYGRAGQAIVAYERAIAAGAQPPAIFFTLGLLYRLVGRRDDARAALTLAARHPFYRRAVALLE